MVAMCTSRRHFEGGVREVMSAPAAEWFTKAASRQHGPCSTSAYATLRRLPRDVAINSGTRTVAHVARPPARVMRRVVVAFSAVQQARGKVGVRSAACG